MLRGASPTPTTTSSKIGTPIAKLDTPITTGHSNWSVAAARHACVIVAWSDTEPVKHVLYGPPYEFAGRWIVGDLRPD